MDRRPLGRTGSDVSAIGFGCYGLGGAYGAVEEGQALATLSAALDLGITLLDTSDAYGAGHNEELIGRAIRGRRRDAFIATKFGNPGRDDAGKPIGVCGRPDYVPVACERSLRRLGTDVIDLYLVHRIDPAVPIEETIGAMAGLVEAGKVRHIGLCEAAPQTIRRAHAVHPLAAVQSEYSLWSRDPEEQGHLATCREFGISFMAYSPLGRGFLAGAVSQSDFGAQDPRSAMPRFSSDNLDHNLAAARRFGRLAELRGVTPAQLALAWLLARGGDILPIPGTRSIGHLEQNSAAVAMRLSAQDMAAIEEALSPSAIRGGRYDPEYMKTVNL